MSLRWFAILFFIGLTGTQSDAQEDNLLRGRSTRASSEETDKQNLAAKAVDGDFETRWCASSDHAPEWLQMDLGEQKTIASLRLHWEQERNAYRYKIDVSANAEDWETVVDQSNNRRATRIVSHEIKPVSARFVRVTFLGSRSGGWGSLFECEAYSGKLPKLPEAATKAMSTASVASLADIKAPESMQVQIFAAPPKVNYPVCLTAAVTGEVFIGVDEQGSLGKKTGGGRILRCVDENGDGQADQVNVFAEVDHPRGLVYDQGNMWVLHPPFLTLFVDKDMDGKADSSQVLIEGISTDQVNKRGADHTTNGIRMGIDGWIYIAVGDFGFNHAKGTDGRVLSKRGGGIVRVRPDGTEMEIYAWGLRNILDVSIDPYLNMFTRDNTNDGGGWNVRVNHILQGANYGYPSLYKNFPDEIMPTLADYGGGSGCGSMYLFDPRWPSDFASAAYTCDWGTSRVYRHRFPERKPTFLANQDEFLELPRPTDIDVDGSGRMYVSSWKDGGFDFSHPNVGFVAQIVPKGFAPEPFPKLEHLRDADLISWMAKGIAVPCLHVQREYLRRGESDMRQRDLEDLAKRSTAMLSARVAAINTLKQLRGQLSHAFLRELVRSDDAVRQYALRALTDRLGECENLDSEFFAEWLVDPSPAVRAQTLISITRLSQSPAMSNSKAIADRIIPLSIVWNEDGTRRNQLLSHELPDSNRVIPHLAVHALISLNAVPSCMEAIESQTSSGAFWALRKMHTKEAVDALIQRLYRPASQEIQNGIIEALARLYFREGDYEKGDWWGTRPDTTGPYFDRQKWHQSDRIEKVLLGMLQSTTDSHAERIKDILKRHRIPFAGDVAEKTIEQQPAILVESADPNNANQIGNMDIQEVIAKAMTMSGDATVGKSIFASQSCAACHTITDGQTPKGPHLADIGKRYSKAELLDSILKPNAKIAQGFESWQFLTHDGTVHVGFVVLESAEAITIRQGNGVAMELLKSDVDQRKKQENSLMPTGLVNALTPSQLADLVAYLRSL